MASELKQEWKNNFKSLWKYSQAVHRGKNAHLICLSSKIIFLGMHGFVRDENGQPINDAEIQIDDRKKIVHSNTNGAFWRLLLPGMRFRNSRIAQKFQSLVPGFQESLIRKL